MKKVLLSVNPKWVAKICNKVGERDGKPIYEKRVEIRKNRPKLETPFTVLIYETMGETETPFVDEEGHHIFKGRGQVIGEFVCDKITKIIAHGKGYGIIVEHPFTDSFTKDSCLTVEQLDNYLKGNDGYGWHISDLVIYDEPKNLCEFSKYGFGHPVPLKRPPQSWCYVEVPE